MHPMVGSRLMHHSVSVLYLVLECPLFFRSSTTNEFPSLLKSFSREEEDEDSSSSSSFSDSSSSSSSLSSKKKKSNNKKSSSQGSYTLDKPMVTTTSVTHLSEPELVVEDDETRTYSIEARF